MKKLGLIIPYRDREEHLKIFAPTITQYLNKVEINHQIYVIEQGNDKLFNRAKLFNVGFELSKENNDYFCFHDVDLIPEKEECDYSSIEGVARLSVHVSQFNYQERPQHEIGGGITLIDKTSFIKMNGYSNNYWGWGAEDDDFSVRLRREKIKIHTRKGRYNSLFHKRNVFNDDKSIKKCVIDNRNTLSKMKQDKNSHKFDGLSNLQYRIIDKQEKDFFILYKVDL